MLPPWYRKKSPDPYPLPDQVAAASETYVRLTAAGYKPMLAMREALLASDKLAWLPIAQANKDGTHYLLYNGKPSGKVLVGYYEPIKEHWITFGGEFIIPLLFARLQFKPPPVPVPGRKKNDPRGKYR